MVKRGRREVVCCLPPETMNGYYHTSFFFFFINIWSHLKGLQIIQDIINNSGLLITYKYAVRCAFIFNMLVGGACTFVCWINKIKGSNYKDEPNKKNMKIGENPLPTLELNQTLLRTLQK